MHNTARWCTFDKSCGRNHSNKTEGLLRAIGCVYAADLPKYARQESNLRPSAPETGTMWSISHPHCSVLPYFSRCMNAPQASFLNEGYLGSGVPFRQTASIVSSSNDAPSLLLFQVLAMISSLVIISRTKVLKFQTGYATITLPRCHSS